MITDTVYVYSCSANNHYRSTHIPMQVALGSVSFTSDVAHTQITVIVL